MKTNSSILIVEGKLDIAEKLAIYNITGIVHSEVKAIEKIPETIPDLILITYFKLST